MSLKFGDLDSFLRFVLTLPENQKQEFSELWLTLPDSFAENKILLWRKDQASTEIRITKDIHLVDESTSEILGYQHIVIVKDISLTDEANVNIDGYSNIQIIKNISLSDEADVSVNDYEDIRIIKDISLANSIDELIEQYRHIVIIKDISLANEATEKANTFQNIQITKDIRLVNIATKQIKTFQNIQITKNINILDRADKTTEAFQVLQIIKDINVADEANDSSEVIAQETIINISKDISLTDAASVALGTFVAPPGVPGLRMSGSGKTGTAHLTAPTSGGTPTSYVVEHSRLLTFATLATTKTRVAAGTITFPNLVAGFHFFRAKCTNSGGDSSWSPIRPLVIHP